MSVNNCYLAVEWGRLDTVPKGEEFSTCLFEAMDEEDGWVGDVPFGEQIDSYYFESWNGLMEFNDWFRERRKSMDQAFVAAFASLFMDVGLLHKDDTYAPSPIKKGLEFEDEWLLASIPPGDVAGLAERAQALDLAVTAREFQAAADAVPCDMVPDGETVAQWVEALRDGLTATVKAGRGIVMGAA